MRQINKQEELLQCIFSFLFTRTVSRSLSIELSELSAKKSFIDRVIVNYHYSVGQFLILLKRNKASEMSSTSSKKKRSRNSISALKTKHNEELTELETKYSSLQNDYSALQKKFNAETGHLGNAIGQMKQKISLLNSEHQTEIVRLQIECSLLRIKFNKENGHLTNIIGDLRKQLKMPRVISEADRLKTIVSDLVHQIAAPEPEYRPEEILKVGEKYHENMVQLQGINSDLRQHIALLKMKHDKEIALTETYISELRQQIKELNEARQY